MRSIRLGPSEIHGQGLLANDDIVAGQMISHEDMVSCTVGFNHSCDPNTSAVKFTTKQVPYRVALRNIKPGEELTVDYRPFGAQPTPCTCPQCKAV